jgi:drug/metabolite transporter (DMT)-like permease
MSLLLRKNSPINAWGAVVIAVIGFYLLCVKSDFSIAPSDLTVFLCTFAFAAQIIAVDILLPTCDGVRISLIQFATVTVLSLVCSLAFEGADSFAPILTCIPEILFLGIGSSGIAYTLQIIGQKDTHPAVASVILSLESVFGALAGAIVLKEVMSPREYVGCAVVFFAVILSQTDFKALVGKNAQT